MRPQAAWKVRIQIARATGPSMDSMRSRISPAALLVNVIARISFGSTPHVASRCATRYVNTRVLPEPAPAITSSGPSVVVTASRCASFRSARYVSGFARDTTPRLPPPCHAAVRQSGPRGNHDRGRGEGAGEVVRVHADRRLDPRPDRPRARDRDGVPVPLAAPGRDGARPHRHRGDRRAANATPLRRTDPARAREQSRPARARRAGSTLGVRLSIHEWLHMTWLMLPRGRSVSPCSRLAPTAATPGAPDAA